MLSIIGVLFLVSAVAGYVVFNTHVSAKDVGISPVSSSRTISLDNGDIYDLRLGYVMQEIDGKQERMVAYNGSIPGPTIRVRQGETITIRLTNSTLISTLLHAHGVRVLNDYDGSPLVQREIAPNETFTYHLRFPDAGVFFYHPLVRDDMVQSLGAYGTIIVSPREQSTFSPVNHEAILTLSDLMVNKAGVMAPENEQQTHTLFGRFGNVYVVNGKAKPETLRINPGSVVRYYVLNVANARPFRVSFQGAQMKRIAGDSAPYMYEKDIDELLLGPGERAIVDVFFPSRGTYNLLHRTETETHVLGSVRAEGDLVSPTYVEQFQHQNSAQGVLEEEYLTAQTFLTDTPTRSVRIGRDLGVSGITDALQSASTTPVPVDVVNTRGVLWEDPFGTVNALATPTNTRWVIRDEESGKENMDIVWRFQKGEMVQIRLNNDSDAISALQHPFHVHGNRFIILRRNGIPNTELVWKDTIFVQGGETVDILVDMSNVGSWLMRGRMNSGMMLEYDVVE